ncbi:MAG: hypothetical protein JSW50_12840, partial [Candidatus Latescibacterota bacterium]
MNTCARTVALAILTVIVCQSSVWAVPKLSYSPLYLHIGPTEDRGVVRIWNKEDGVLNWSMTSNVEWLTLSQSSGTIERPTWAYHTEVEVYVDRTGFATGSYPAELAITSNGGDAICYVTMHVQVEPVLSLSPDILHVALNQPNRPLRIYNGGQETLTWTASGDAPWFSIVPPSGSVGSLTYSEVSVVLDPSALPSQTDEHTGTITVTSNGGESSVGVTFIPIWATGGIVGL